jgi:anti-sigma-K factor RskA
MTRPDDDLDAWLAGLRGQSGDATDRAAAEGADTRRALLAARAASAEHSRDAGDDAQSLQRLLFRLRRDGLLHADAAAARTRRWRLPMAAAAALVAGLALTLALPPELWRGEDEIVLRGDGAVQLLRVDDAAAVAATAARLESALRAAGAQVAVFDLEGGGREVAATVPAAQLQPAARALARDGVALGANGLVRVEIRVRR